MCLRTVTLKRHNQSNFFADDLSPLSAVHVIISSHFASVSDIRDFAEKFEIMLPIFIEELESGIV